MAQQRQKRFGPAAPPPAHNVWGDAFAACKCPSRRARSPDRDAEYQRTELPSNRRSRSCCMPSDDRAWLLLIRRLCSRPSGRRSNLRSRKQGARPVQSIFPKGIHFASDQRSAGITMYGEKRSAGNRAAGKKPSSQAEQKELAGNSSYSLRKVNRSPTPAANEPSQEFQPRTLPIHSMNDPLNGWRGSGFADGRAGGNTCRFSPGSWRSLCRDC